MKVYLLIMVKNLLEMDYNEDDVFKLVGIENKHTSKRINRLETIK